jgi:hypothetical protein
MPPTHQAHDTIGSHHWRNWIRREIRSVKAEGMTAEVFLTAFRTLPKKEQDVFLGKMLKDRRLREDLIDIAIGEERSGDKARPFREIRGA